MAADKEKIIEVGQKAPAFTLPDQDDKSVKLSDFKGSWLVLYFYPNDDTPGCTTEACDFTNGLKDFEKLDATVVGCSPNTTESHRKFIAKYKLKVRLLSDPEHKAMTAYGAWGEKVLYGKKSIGVIRSTAIISPDGKIAHHWARVKSAGHAEAVREKLKAAPRRLSASIAPSLSALAGSGNQDVRNCRRQGEHAVKPQRHVQGLVLEKSAAGGRFFSSRRVRAGALSRGGSPPKRNA